VSIPVILLPSPFPPLLPHDLLIRQYQRHWAKTVARVWDDAQSWSPKIILRGMPLRGPLNYQLHFQGHLRCPFLLTCIDLNRTKRDKSEIPPWPALAKVDLVPWLSSRCIKVNKKSLPFQIIIVLPFDTLLPHHLFYKNAYHIRRRHYRHCIDAGPRCTYPRVAAARWTRRGNRRSGLEEINSAAIKGPVIIVCNGFTLVE